MRSCCLLLFYLTAAQAADFSAEFVYGSYGKLVWGKAYVTDRKIRLDSEDGSTSNIFDLDKKTHRIVVNHKPGRVSDLEEKFYEPPLGGPLRDPANPCAQFEVWFGEPPEKLIPCKRIGPEKLNGRNVVKWEVTAEGEGIQGRIYVWIDPALRHSIKYLVAGAGEGGKDLVLQELRNIKPGPQPASLFDIPPDAEKK